MKKYLHFHWADYTIFGAFLLLFTFIGVLVSWLDRKKTSAKDYLMGGGQSHWAMVGLSMQASFLSAIFILSGPGEIYTYGTAYSFISIATCIAIPLAIRFYLPVYYRLNLISAYEYLERRFNRTTRILASLLFSIQTLLYLSVVLYAPALALSQATNFSITWSIGFCGIVCTVYTSLGGMKATIWNDTIQMTIIYVGLIMVLVKGTMAVGGIERAFNLNIEGGRIIVNKFSLDPTLRTTFWTQVVGGLFVFLPPYSVNQAIIQKAIGCRSMAQAKKSLYFSLTSSLVIQFLVTALGMVMYAFYHDCDPIKSGQVTKIDQIIPLLVIELLGDHPGLPGLFMATIFSAALSSMSGCLNSLSAVVLTDFVLPVYNKKSREMSERLRVILSKVFVFSFGILATFLSFQAHYLGKSVLQLSLTVMPSIGSTMLGLVTLGIFLKFVNAKGAVAGFVTSCVFVIWLSMGSIYSDLSHPVLPLSVNGCSANMTTFGNQTLSKDISEMTTIKLTSNEPIYPYRIAFLYFGPMGFILTVVVGVAVSLATGRTKMVDPALLYSRSRSTKEDDSKDDVEMEEKTSLENSFERVRKVSTAVDCGNPNDEKENLNTNDKNNF